MLPWIILSIVALLGITYVLPVVDTTWPDSPSRWRRSLSGVVFLLLAAAWSIGLGLSTSLLIVEYQRGGGLVAALFLAVGNLAALLLWHEKCKKKAGIIDD